MTAQRALRVAVLGCGTVGTEVVRRLHEAAQPLGHRIGAPVILTGIAVRDPRRPRDVGVPPELFTDDALELVKRGDNDIVVELLGGVEPARGLVTAALEHGASVVSANKALMAAYGRELHETAAQRGVDLCYEAAVAGAIPLLRPLRESLAGDDITRITGIVNGTTNYILDRMSSTGDDYREALAEAARLGYAEADPTADVDGHDAAAKAVILSALAFHTWIPVTEVRCEGIRSVTPADMVAARAMGCEVKLVAVCERDPASGDVAAQVHPALVPSGHPLASVRGADNAVVVESAAAGRLLFHGPGAGGAPTASAVLGDVVCAARAKARGSGPVDTPPQCASQSRSAGELSFRHHLRPAPDVTDSALDDLVAMLRRHGIHTAQVTRRSAESAASVVTAPVSGARIAAALAAGRADQGVRPVRVLRMLDQLA